MSRPELLVTGAASGKETTMEDRCSSTRATFAGSTARPFHSWPRLHARVCLLIAAVLLAVTQPRGVAAAPVPVPRAALTPGTVVTLAGTPHLWFAGDDGLLHWGGDTRGLAGKSVNWENHVELSRPELMSYGRGDPWLSAGLLKVGEPIYFVKWETSERQPRLLHILSIADVELFGIDSSNYYTFIMDQATWEARYGIKVVDLAKGVLGPASPVATGAVLLADTFDKPDTGILPKTSPAPTTYTRGYEGG